MTTGLSNASALSDAQSQMQLLAQLQRRIGHADAATLINIRNEVTSTIAASQSMVQQAKANSGSLSAAQLAVYQEGEAARGSVTSFMHDYYDQKKFDRYLSFASATDEEEYRKRESERHDAIEEALGQQTPQGTLRANRLAIEQLKDAGAHGADRSPDYQLYMHDLQDTDRKLGGAIAATKAVASHSVAAADPLDVAPSARHVPPELLASLQANGVTLPDQQGDGHGLTSTTARPVARARE